MRSLSIEFPETVLIACGWSREEFIRESKFLLVAKLFELGRLSSGKAAELCGLSRPEFLLAMGRLGVPVADLDDSELEREFSDA